MSEQIATPAPTAAVTVQPTKAPINFGEAGVKLTTLEDAYRFATAVVKSGLAPKGFNTSEAVLIALQHGAEIGLPPMASLQSIAVINGRPGIFGDAALALVRGSGLCVYHGEAETNDATDPTFRELQFALYEKDTEKAKKLSREFAIAQSKHKTDSDDFGVTIATVRRDGMMEFERFTIGDAKRAGLWGKEGPWKQYPKRMLKFRARGFKLRDVYGDVLKGLRTVEELQDTPPERNVTPQASLQSIIGTAEESGATLQPSGEIVKESTPTAAAQETTPPPADTPTVEPAPQGDRQSALDVLQGVLLDTGASEAFAVKTAIDNGWTAKKSKTLADLDFDALTKVTAALKG